MYPIWTGLSKVCEQGQMSQNALYDQILQSIVFATHSAVFRYITKELRGSICSGVGGWGVTWGSIWYGCVSQYFETYPIHIPGLWKNRLIHILDRPKCWPIHILSCDFYTHLLLVVRQSIYWIRREQAPLTKPWVKIYTHLPGCQKSGAFHIQIKKNRVSHTFC